MSAINLNAYFERIGFAGSIAPTLATLQALHGLHPSGIAFENLDAVLGLPILLDQPSLERKILRDRRGGFCFEQNTLFRRVLEDLDFTVTSHFASVLWGHPEGEERPLSHLVLTVELGGITYLCDVGFGAFTLTAPLKLRAEVEQETPNETFRLLDDDGAYRLQVRLGEDWRSLYRFSTEPRSEEEAQRLSDIIAADHYDWRLLMASRITPEGRINLRRDRLSIYRPGEPPDRRIIQTFGEIKDILVNQFAITLPASELLDPALVRVLETAHAEEEARQAALAEASPPPDPHPS